MRVLVTNDDGIKSEGLHALAAKLSELGHDTVVAAPDRDQSGTGASLGVLHADQHLDVRRVEVPGAPGVPAFAVDGTPGLCVVAARLGAFGGAPDAVVSGINNGANVGRAVLHSGTVGAALTAQNFGMKGLAVSLDGRGPWPWHTAVEIAGQILELLVDAPPCSVLNLNVPALPLDEVLGVRWGHLDGFGSVRSAIAEAEDGRLQFELVATDHAPEPESDRGLLAARYAAVTSLVGVAEAWPEFGEASPEVEERTVPGAPVASVPGPHTSRLTLRRR